MAERIQDILAGQKAAQLDAGNSRAARILRSLQQAVARADARGAFADNGVVPPITPENSEVQGLVTAESAALQRFFEKEVEVPQPPRELFQTVEALKGRGIARFEPHYFPTVELHQQDKLPGWTVKPEPWFWNQVKSGRVASDAPTLRAGWYLVDGRVKPDYYNGQQRYDDDAWFQATIHELRGFGSVKTMRGVVSDSRFGVSPYEVEQVILPEFARTVGTAGVVRTPRVIEFNVLGNIYHPEWGDTNTWEIMNDKFGGGGRLIGGGSVGGGLAGVSGCWADGRHGGVAFRSLIDFSQL